MKCTRFEFKCALIVAALLACGRVVDAALVVNNDPIGPAYTIQSIDGGVTVDFTATAPVAGNNQTIGKLKLTPNHGSLVWLGFTLKENAAAAANSAASGGLRLLLDVSDRNGMTVPWIDYHIRAVDTSTPADPVSEASHLMVAHFHDTTAGFGSNPLVIQGASDNVVQLDYGLGAAVFPTFTFTATNILLHERDFAGLQRQFRVETIPSVPEPTTFVVWALVIGLVTCAKPWRIVCGLTG